MFAVVLTYTAPLEAIDAHLSEHGAWLEGNYADGVFLASGRREPRTGGVILVDTIPRSELDARLATDPFHLNGLAQYEIIEFIPSRLATGVVLST